MGMMSDPVAKAVTSAAFCFARAGLGSASRGEQASKPRHNNNAVRIIFASLFSSTCGPNPATPDTETFLVRLQLRVRNLAVWVIHFN